MLLFYSQSGSTVAFGDSGFLFEVYSSLCQALGQCRWAKKANEKRKKHESSENKVNLSPHLSRSFLHFFSIRFPHYLGFTAIESFLRTQNCPYCPLLLFNRGSLWILLDNPRADMPVLRPSIRIPSIDSAGYCDDIKILMKWYCLDGKIKGQLQQSTDRRPTDFLGNCSSNLPFGPYVPTYHQGLTSRLGFWNLSCINLWLWWFCIWFSVVIEIYRGFSVLGNF